MITSTCAYRERPRRRLVLGALVACTVLASSPASRAEPGRELLGRSAQGRPIELVRLGDPRAHERILVVGCIHGDEDAGIAVVRGLLRAGAPPEATLWVVPNLNPDGLAGRHRQNGRGVDLNRNFGAMWRAIGRRWDPQHAGPRPWSEPETRLIRALILRIRPTVTIWFHQPQGLVRAWGPSVPAGRRYARVAGERFRALPWPSGSGPNWQNHRFPGAASFVVELGPGPLSPAAVERHVRAIRRFSL
jgi:protein MpaA